jgi:hypothetical protein
LSNTQKELRKHESGPPGPLSSVLDRISQKDMHDDEVQAFYIRYAAGGD